MMEIGIYYLPLKTVSETDQLKKQLPEPEVFYKKSVLKNFAKFTGKHLCQEIYLKALVE